MYTDSRASVSRKYKRQVNKQENAGRGTYLHLLHLEYLPSHTLEQSQHLFRWRPHYLSSAGGSGLG